MTTVYWQHMEDVNDNDLRESIRRGTVVAIVDEDEGGIIGYTFRGRADDFVNALRAAKGEWVDAHGEAL